MLPTRARRGSAGALVGRWLPVAAFLAAALASLATSAPRMERAFPTWELSGAPERTVGCAQLSLEVGKAGKQGLGLLLHASGSGGCEVAVTAATLVLANGEQVPAVLPASALLEGEEARQVRLWLPFPFDAEARWNDGIREGTVRLTVRAGPVEERWELPALHVLRHFHEERRREPAAGQEPAAPEAAPPAAAPPPPAPAPEPSR